MLPSPSTPKKWFVANKHSSLLFPLEKERWHLNSSKEIVALPWNLTLYCIVSTVLYRNRAEWTLQSLRCL